LAKTGGRRPGSRNKATTAREAAIEASGLSPLAYMLSVVRDESAPVALRLDAAAKSAPYVHPRRSAVDDRRRTVPVTVQVIRFAELGEAEGQMIEHEPVPVPTARH
jgi:hypothetical protein